MFGIGNDCFRPYMIGKNKQVKKIVFYYDGEVKLTVNNGWLEDKASSYPNDVKYLDIDEPRRANKAILTKNDDFYIKSDDQGYSFDSTYYDLYLYVEPTFIKEYVNHKSDDDSRFHYYKTYTVPVSGKLSGDRAVEEITIEVFSRIEEHEDLRIKNIQEKIEGKSGVKIDLDDLEKLLAVYKFEEKR